MSSDYFETSSTRYTVVWTADGSPSLRLSPRSEEAGEAMHHSQGAFSETIAIYFPAADATFKHGLTPTFLSVGLGLGYNEILTLCVTLKYTQAAWPAPLHILSFEADTFLQEQFFSFFRKNECHPFFEMLFQKIVNFFSLEFSLPVETIRHFACDALKREQMSLKGSLTLDTTFPKSASCIYFDAFSARTSPTLWDKEFLTHFIDNACLPKAFFTTYASRTALKKILKTAGFKVEKKSGFAGKRESTFAFRL